MASFIEVIDQVVELLRHRGRLSYRVLKREFGLDDEQLEEIKEDLIEVQELAADKDGKMLVWTGDGQSAATPNNRQSQHQTPASYTPQHLAERILAEQTAMESRGAANGERKTITALFADLKGSTALIEGLDPEDARSIIDPALQIMMDAVHRYDGYVAQALGDGIFALFGAPIAHEDHPQRALYAALRMQEEMRQHSDQSRLKGGIPLQMRVGINTGEVVVRSIRKDDLHTDYVPVGHSTNLAARMEQLATPGSIVISEYTRKLTEGYFDLKSLGAADIKGVAEPLNVYEVVGAGPLRTRLQVSARRGLTRFVGRHSELDQMQRALEQAKAGHGQILGVMGEPGLGKSRLFYEFKLTSQRGCLVLEAFSVSHGKASPYLPLIELLKDYFQIEPTDDERARRQKLLGHVLDLDRRLEDTLPYLFSLLGTDDPASSLQQMDAQIRRQRTFEALKKLFLRESLNQPLILIFEDLHWIDSETQGFLDTLSERVASTQLLVLVNYRPEYRHEWGQKTYYTQLRLTPLGQAEADELLTFLLGTDASLTRLKPLILEKTEGTPFFIEEVVQTLVEEGALSGERGNYRLETTPTALHISPTVQGVLAARIDRLSAEEKTLLQQLSVIGRQLPVGLIKQVVSQPETELHRVLASLQAKEFLYEQPAFPEVEYLFKHALTQDVAYGTVLQEQRKALHERIAQAMEALYKENLDDHYGDLAHHYRQSGNTAKAVEYLYLAGQQAVQRSANAEAVRYLTSALELLNTLPNTEDRTEIELALHIALGRPLIASQGYNAPELGRVYLRAGELSQRLGETPQRFSVLHGLWLFYFILPDGHKSMEVAQQLLRLAQHLQNPLLLQDAHYALGWAWLFQGEFVRGHDQFERGVTLITPQQRSSDALLLAQDAGVACLAISGFALWHLGFPEQALQRVQRAHARARELSHPVSWAYSLGELTLLHHLCREGEATQDWAEAGIAYTTEHGLPYWRAWSTLFHGWARAKQGAGEEGIARIREGLAVFHSFGAESYLPYLSAVLADTYSKVGRAQEGLSMLTEALSGMKKTGERLYEAELYRLKGEFVLQLNTEGLASPAAAEAEACFQHALVIARRQQAKSWELRAATSLARLWQSQRKQTEARELLTPVYNWFTEGFDTADLKDAKALLAELR